MPFYHSYGLSVFCFRTFATPSTLVIMPKWDVKLVSRLIPQFVSLFLTQLRNLLSAANSVFSYKRWKVTLLPVVPAMIFQLVNSPEWEKADTSSVETTASGTALLPPALKAKFQSRLQSTLFEGFGSTESVRPVPYPP